MTPFDAPAKQPFENTVGKGEIARNEQFILYPVFFTCLENFLLFSSNFKLSSADCFNLDLSKILSSGNGLIRRASLCSKMLREVKLWEKEKIPLSAKLMFLILKSKNFVLSKCL